MTGVHGMQGGEAVKTLKGLLRSCGLVQSASRGHRPRRHISFTGGTKVCGISDYLPSSQFQMGGRFSHRPECSLGGTGSLHAQRICEMKASMPSRTHIPHCPWSAPPVQKSLAPINPRSLRPVWSMQLSTLYAGLEGACVSNEDNGACNVGLM